MGYHDASPGKNYFSDVEALEVDTLVHVEHVNGDRYRGLVSRKTSLTLGIQTVQGYRVILIDNIAVLHVKHYAPGDMFYNPAVKEVKAVHVG